MKEINIVLLSISSPIQIGVYEGNLLIDTLVLQGQSSEVLVPTFDDLLKKYSINSITYVNTPGSFMAIKLAYICLKTLSITNNIIIKSIDGFYFNNNKPIKAIGNRFFIKEDNKIILDKISTDKKCGSFSLPQKINLDDFSDDIEPNYILPSV
jgi:hypothetical protein